MASKRILPAQFGPDGYAKTPLNDLMVYSIYSLHRQGQAIPAEDIISACFVHVPQAVLPAEVSAVARFHHCQPALGRLQTQRLPARACRGRIPTHQENAELVFYFHRGDSWGEGGSGQRWDSELLPELLKMIPKGSHCVYLTDGVPGGFENRHSSEVFELNAPFIERSRTYYCGKFFPEALHA